tara:strand:+ start:275 stop:637 length:363 start_codon:yes stop_codon:yes gene_type:complete
MNWPPTKAFTSTKSIYGFRHFVAINYGGNGKTRWVNLVSVLDGNIRFRVLWIELKNINLWSSGWQELSRDQSNLPNIINNKAKSKDYHLEKACLHLSLDSGLDIPLENGSIRNWFEDSEK